MVRFTCKFKGLEMINPTAEKWRTIPGHPNYQMSNQGRVRNAKHNNKLINPRPTNHKKMIGTGYYIYVDAEQGHFWQASRWYALTWPELPPIDFTDQWREAVIKFNDLPKRQPKTERKPRANKRPCTDCGKPTTDYRCAKCWKKRRATVTGAEPASVYKTAYGGW